MIASISEAIERKDSVTAGHAKRVALFAGKIGKRLGLDDLALGRLELGALLHDAGKVEIDDRILKKAAPLDECEWPIMRTHPEVGLQPLSAVPGCEDIVSAMRFHHERWDGAGYPIGLSGESIPLIARIVAVADCYDAMISSRPYKRGLPADFAAEEIHRNSGKQFCPSVSDAFLRAYSGGDFRRSS